MTGCDAADDLMAQHRRRQWWYVCVLARAEFVKVARLEQVSCVCV